MAPPQQHQQYHQSSSSAAAPTTATAAQSYKQAADRLKKLASPPPASFPLKAAVLLLSDGIPNSSSSNINDEAASAASAAAGQTVYLMDRAYLANWLIWCLHQRVTVAAAATNTSNTHTNNGGGNKNNNNHYYDEAARLQESIRLAALQYHLVTTTTEMGRMPAMGMPYTDPGPVDSSSLSMAGHALLLDATVQIYQEEEEAAVESNVTGMSSSSSRTMKMMNGSSSNNNNRSSSSSRAMPKGGGGGVGSLAANRTHSLGTNMMKSASSASAAALLSREQRNLAFDRVHSTPSDGKTDPSSSSKKYCVAVPERFYELLRSVHGVLCDDFETVSFQPAPSSAADEAVSDRSLVLHHHQYNSSSSSSNGNNGSSTTAQQQYDDANDSFLHNNTTADSAAPRPIEFRRKVVWQTAVEKNKGDKDCDFPVLSLMEKLVLEQQTTTRQLVVEVHPIKLLYSFCTTAAPAVAVMAGESASSSSAAAAASMMENGTKTANSSSSGSTATAKTMNGGTATAAAAAALKYHHHQPQMRGFVLVSRDAPAAAAVTALQRLVAPNKASQSVRTWSKWEYTSNSNSNSNNASRKKRAPTATHDGYELVDLDILSEAFMPIQQQQQPAIMNGDMQAMTTQHHHQPCVLSTGDWVEQHHAAADTKELELLLETRRTVNSPWPRAAYELDNRLQPGDLVDAQDVAGKWYEAVVREVDHETVLVHYTGWASRWDSKARRRKPAVNDDSSSDSPPHSPAGVPSKVKAPAPLWSQSGRWRERLQLGDTVEVRDSSSIVERPKWYRGVVKRVGGINDAPRPLTGGADLETYSLTEEEEKKPLLLLGRTQQILVEVEQERSDKASIARCDTSPTSSDSLTPHPPFLRWVNLFGEEICKSGTHLNEIKEEGPVTLRYEFDNNRKPVAVMKSHPTLGSGFMRESLRGTPPAPGSVGLHNLGNSCFLNSTVQCLNHIEPLTQFFLQDKYSKDLNKRNPLGSGGNVAVAYASLLKKMWAGNHSVLVPRLLKQTVASFAPQFDNSYQHDSHEFCQFLMDGLHEDLNRVKKKPYVEELEGFGMEDQKAAIESWRKHLLRHDSIIVDHCQGMHRSHLTCPQCGRESIKFDVYSSISLPLPTEKIKTTIKLEDCIEKFMEAEQLDERDAYYCPSCRRHVCALKLIALWTVPDILILHLKRFTFDTCMLSGGMLRSKVDNTVEFPINGLDLTKQVLGPIDPAAPPIYNLFGVSEHTGPTANSGHYTATIRNSVDGHWYRCNDSHVGLTSGEASITGGAYLLFYQRAKGITKWGGLHKVMKELGIDPYGGMDPIDEQGFRQVKNKKKKKG